MKMDEIKKAEQEELEDYIDTLFYDSLIDRSPDAVKKYNMAIERYRIVAGKPYEPPEDI